MDTIPMWLLGPGFTLILVLLVEAGYRLHAWLLRSRADAATGAQSWWQIGGISLNLLTLLLAFTVSMAAGRFEQRRNLVVGEANAISTSYLRAQLFSEPGRSHLGALISQYARERGKPVDFDDPAAVARAGARADSLRAEIMAVTRTAIRQPGDGSMAFSFVQAVTQMFEVAATRKAYMDNRVPSRIILVLVTFSMVTALIVGASRAAAGRRQPVVTTLVVVMIGSTIALIVDLDRPGTGRIVVNQAQLEKVNAEIARSEAYKAEGQPAPSGDDRP
jgi:amino acid permease